MDRRHERSNRRLAAAGAAMAFALLGAACSSDDVPQPAVTTTTTATQVSPVPTTVPAPPVELPAGEVVTVSGDLSGNRYAPGTGAALAAAPVDVALSGTPLWVAGAATDAGIVWVVALDDGRLEGWRLDGDGAEATPLDLAALPAGTPPVLLTGPEGLVVVDPPPAASPLTHPAPLEDGGLMYVTLEGSVIAQRGDEALRFDVAALPDTRIAVADDGLVAVLAEPTSRYPHGVVGDEFEAGRVVIIDPTAGEVVAEAVVPEPAVIEGIAALWADVDGDGRQEILVTVSDSAQGARLVVVDRNGQVFAEGPAVGLSNRWRNQLGVAPVGPGGELEVVDVRVPHIGGIVEYFRFDQGRLVLEAEQPGYTSHVIWSRNLDLALAADVDGDGTVEVLVPTQSRDVLGVLRRTPDGVDIVTELALPGVLTSNVVAAADGEGGLAFAAGTDDRVLRIWPAPSP